MAKPKDLFSHAATIIPVKDVLKSAAFYRDLLGFEVTFSWGEPVDYVVLKGNENLSVHLTKRHKNHPPDSGNHVVLYIFVHDVDQLYNIYQQREISIHTSIGTREYDMRDFDIKDLDGHIISFGTGV